ncbi:helix-turn-helix domain-containing protein [Agrilactobacillus fermenti]|uniref:helix-turn-helix domain-containing protein n=1 Tax=Agrilactobacillus fermenti TaxID=2586909 RepID=UPI003A5BB499
MTQLGPTIKYIRQIKGLSQKEVYQGIISRSFAHRLEQGAHSIDAEKFLAILVNLDVTPDEFQFIHNHHQLTKNQQAYAKIDTWYQTHNFLALHHWLVTQKQSQTDQLKWPIAYAEILIAAYDQKQFPLSKHMFLLLDHLLTEKNWTLNEMRLAHLLLPLCLPKNTAPLIDIEKIKQRMQDNAQQYLKQPNDYFHVTDLLVEFYGTQFQVLLNQHRYTAAKHLKSDFNTIDIQKLTWDGRITQQLWLAIWELYFGDKHKGQIIIKKLTDLMTLFPVKYHGTLDAIIKVRTAAAADYRKK